MAETQPKRQREHEQKQEHEQQEENLFSCHLETTKRHKSSYNQILSILDDNTEEEDEHQETNQDLTAFFISLQQELSAPHPLPETIVENDPNVKEEDKEKVIKHLLEASDDELGIPNRVADDEALNEKNVGLWELEDDVANYFSLVHSDLIM